MSRLKMNVTSPKVRELEITAQNDSWFWVGWIVLTTSIFILASRALPSFTLISIPFWLLWAIGLVVCALRGWMGVIWSRSGVEVVRVFTDRIEYRAAGGSRFDRKKVDVVLAPSENPIVELLTFGLRDGQNRLHLKATRGGFYFGRSLSTEEAQAVLKAMVEWLSPTYRGAL